jgi:hypothetical protein
MRLSRGKMVHLSHKVIETLEGDETIELLRDSNAVRLEVFKVINEEMKIEEEIENAVRRKIESQKKGIPEGSREWDILFKQYFDEEISKLRKVRE